MSLPASPLDADAIRMLLRQVIDPEVGVNIVDLGLVYRVEVTADAVSMDLTMTSPACPMGDMILDDIDAVLSAALPPEIQVNVQLVWDPPWNPGMMKPEARKHFGWQDGSGNGS